MIGSFVIGILSRFYHLKLHAGKVVISLLFPVVVERTEPLMKVIRHQETQGVADGRFSKQGIYWAVGKN